METKYKTWTKNATLRTINDLLDGGRIENVGEGNSSGMEICSLKYLKEHESFVDNVNIQTCKLPSGKYQYVYFYVEDGFHKKSETSDYFTIFKTIRDVEKFLLTYFDEFEDEFYDNRETKIFYKA